MNFNTMMAKESVAQIATLFSDLVVEYVKSEDGATIIEVEQGMLQLLKEVGRQALVQVL